MKRAIYFLFALLLIFSIKNSTAQIPQVVSYQGMLINPATGTPLNGNFPIQFSIYNLPAGGTVLWVEAQNVTVTDGLFNVLLGILVPIPFAVFDGNDKFLGVKVGADPEMTPRMRIASVGYSFRTFEAEKLDGLDASNFAPAIHDHNAIYYIKNELNTNDGTVNQPGDPVSWFKIKDLPPGFADGVDNVGTAGGISQINVGPGMTVTNPTGPTTILDLNMGHGNGINADLVDSKHAADFATTIHNHWGQVWSGWTGPGDGFWLKGNVGWSSGIFLVDNNNTGPAIWGYNNGGGNAVRGDAENANSIGVYGGSDLAAGVVGRSGNASGVEGYGYYGVYSEGTQTAVVAKSTSGYGLFASTSGSAPVAAVWGYCNGSGWAGYFSGNAHVTGTLSKGAGGFMIDHPLDPANKYLYHSFVESPDMMNIYNGNVTLDDKGEAVVELPNWFGALNKDFRYQLTCIGGFAPVYIADEISSNRFRIAGGKPGLKVSWQVTGIRQDAYANAHRLPVEVEKSGAERGKYLHPKEYNLPETLGINSEKVPRVENTSSTATSNDNRSRQK